MTKRLTEYGRFYGMEINVEKTKVMRISRQPSPIQIMIHKKKQPKNVACFSYLARIITNYEMCI